MGGEASRLNGRKGGRPRAQAGDKRGANMLRNKGEKFAGDMIGLEADMMGMFRSQMEIEDDLAKMLKLQRESGYDDLTMLSTINQINESRKIKLGLAAELRMQLKEIAPYVFAKAPPSEWADESSEWKETTKLLKKIWKEQDDNRNTDEDATADSADVLADGA